MGTMVQKFRARIDSSLDDDRSSSLLARENIGSRTDLRSADGWLRQVRVLLADTDDNLRRVLAAALRSDGYDVTEASNGFDLLNQISDVLYLGDTSGMPDIIIMNIRMPGVTGLSILAGLRDAKWRIPIVLLSAECGTETRRRAERLGANALFESPFDIDDLRTVVLNLVYADRWGSFPYLAWSRDAMESHPD